jgi:hypothetical protein
VEQALGVPWAVLAVAAFAPRNYGQGGGKKCKHRTPPLELSLKEPLANLWRFFKAGGWPGQIL